MAETRVTVYFVHSLFSGMVTTLYRMYQSYPHIATALNILKT